MNPKYRTLLFLLVPVVFGANGILAVLSPAIYGASTKIVATVLGSAGIVLGLMGVLHVPASVQAVFADVVQAFGSTLPASAKTLAAKLGIKVAGAVLLLLVLASLSGCISSAPIVPETAANAAQISSCQGTAVAHNDLVIGDFVLSGLGGGSGVVAAALTDQGQKTAFATGAAVAAVLLTTTVALTAYTAATFANGNCSSVVGPLPVTPFGVKKADAPLVMRVLR